MQKEILSRAPVRICDIGGWTDTHFYKDGAIFNISINLYSYIRIIRNRKNRIRIISENLDLKEEFNIDNIEYNGNLDLLKAAVKTMDIQKGLDIYARAEIPPGSGTGTSASISVALIAVLAEFKDLSLARFEIADLAHSLETEELNLESGVQDQYAASYGGINFMEIDYPNVKISKIILNKNRLLELESQLILVYIGHHQSNKMHLSVINNVKKGDTKTLKALDNLRECAYKMKKTITKGTIKEVGNIMNENWQAQKDLHPSMTNSKIQNLEDLVFKNGAIGFKCNGAGGGGSFTLLARKGYEYNLKQTLLNEGYTLLPCKFDFNGVQTWESNLNT
jgi:D-glycero-alpha-D-manno-heptose-7-phosphate kinase